MKALAKDRLPELIQVLSKDYTVYIPALINDASRFVPWNGELDIELTNNTVLPPKDILFPQTEKMYSFQAHGANVAIAEFPTPQESKILFGIRSCDVRSFLCLDQVFQAQGFEDEFYQQKRSTTLLIAMSCTAPSDTCFCHSMGINPLEAEGADLQIYDLGEQWGLKPLTVAGERLFLMVEQLLQESIAEPLDIQPQFIQVEVTGVASKLGGLFNHPLWAETSEKCLGCGLCAYLCPTCHCFDIAGSVKGEQGYKFRCWDCCMFSEYTRMAGGHNPRPSKKERVRNRFLHKLHYFPERYGMLLCTGCGRCIAKCPVGMDITAVIDRVREAEIDE